MRQCGIETDSKRYVDHNTVEQSGLYGLRMSIWCGGRY